MTPTLQANIFAKLAANNPDLATDGASMETVLPAETLKAAVAEQTAIAGSKKTGETTYILNINPEFLTNPEAPPIECIPVMAPSAPAKLTVVFEKPKCLKSNGLSKDNPTFNFAGRPSVTAHYDLIQSMDRQTLREAMMETSTLQAILKSPEISAPAKLTVVFEKPKCPRKINCGI